MDICACAKESKWVSERTENAEVCFEWGEFGADKEAKLLECQQAREKPHCVCMCARLYEIQWN